MKTILVIGNSWGAYNFVQHINKDKYNLKIISKTNDFVYTPFLPKCLVSELNISETVPGTIQDEIIDVNFKEKTVYSQSKQYKYDYIIFAIGANANTFNIPGIENCYCKNFGRYSSVKNEINGKENVSIIGLGPTGSEIVGYLLDQKKYCITAIDALNMPLNSFHVDLQNKVISLWKKK